MSKLIDAVKNSKHEYTLLVVSLATLVSLATISVIGYHINKLEERIHELEDSRDGIMDIIGAQIQLSATQNKAIRDIQGISLNQ